MKNDCIALSYNLKHLRVDFKYARMEFLRDHADPIRAMLNGYYSKAEKTVGQYKKYEANCFITKSALAEVGQGWGISGKKPHQEHVIPLNTVGRILISKSPFDDHELLELLNDLVIPCLISLDQNDRLKTAGVNEKIPMDWDGTDPWARYKRAKLHDGRSLFDEVIALRSNLPNCQDRPIWQQFPTKLLPKQKINCCQNHTLQSTYG